MSIAEFYKVVADQSVIYGTGLSRRVTSGGVYQNQSWVECMPGFVVVCDNKGCDTVIPVSWVVASEDGEE